MGNSNPLNASQMTDRHRWEELMNRFKGNSCPSWQEEVRLKEMLLKEKLLKIEGVGKKIEVQKLIVTNDSNLEYLFGIDFGGVFVIDIETSSSRLYVPLMEYWKTKELLGSFSNIIAYSRYKFGIEDEIPFFEGNKNDIIQSELKGRSKIAIDVDLRRDCEMQKILSQKEVVSVYEEFVGIRRIKLKEEVEVIKKSVEITERALVETLGNIKDDDTERSLYSKFIFNVFSSGADKLAFDPIVAVDANASNPHAIPGGRIVRGSRVLLFDVGAKYLNYSSDMTRTVPLANGDRDVSSILETLEEAYYAAQDLALPGNETKVLDSAARKILEKRGLSKYFLHSLGHGIGINVHEPPSIGPLSTEKLLAGEVIAIEPGVYIPGKIGLRIENTVVVTEKGGRPLNKLDLLLLRK